MTKTENVNIREKMEELDFLLQEIEEKLEVYSSVYFTLFDRFKSVVFTTQKLQEKVNKLIEMGLDFTVTKEAFKSSKKEGFFTAIINNVLPLGFAFYYSYKAQKEQEDWEKYLNEKLSTIKQCREQLMNLKDEQITFARNYADEMMKKLTDSYPYFYQYEITAENFYFFEERVKPFLMKSTGTYYKLLRLRALTSYVKVLVENVRNGEFLDRKTASERFIAEIAEFPYKMFELSGGEEPIKRKILNSGLLFFSLNEDFSASFDPWRNYRKKIVKLARKRGIKI
ncbi:hypothetical protein [Desulfurobacterium atlanticum]|nr:hypothetical protein [Desulfurobacterium atlanticum]